MRLYGDVLNYLSTRKTLHFYLPFLLRVALFVFHCIIRILLYLVSFSVLVNNWLRYSHQGFREMSLTTDVDITP
jgi:hypothetical protein